MRRGSSGRADETCATRIGRRPFAPDCGFDDEDEGDAVGVTVGNRPVKFGGVIVVPATGTSVVGRVGIGLEVGGGGVDVMDPTDVVIDAPDGESPVALTVTEKVIGTPGVALGRTLSVTFSSRA